jgi:hypothetical protein
MSPDFSHWYRYPGGHCFAEAQALGFQVPQPPESQGLHDPSDRGEGGSLSLGDTPEGAALVPEVHRMLQLLRIERPPLAAANAPSIRQGGVPAAVVCSKPPVGGAQADSRLGSKVCEGLTVVNVSAQQSFPAQGCQPSVRVGMHGA